MCRYLDIINVSIFLTSLYILISNLVKGQYKNTILQSVTLLSIILLKLFTILNYNYSNEIYFYKCMTNLIVLTFLVKLELDKIQKKSKDIVLVLNYLLILIALFLPYYINDHLYSMVISIYVLITNLYLFSIYISNEKFNVKYIIHFMFIIGIFLELILEENIFIENINLILVLVCSSYILVKIFKVYVKLYYDKSVDIISKLNRSNINIKIHDEKLNIKKATNKNMNKIITKKENILNLMLKSSQKTMFLIDNENYIINEDNSFYDIWNEYIDYEYNISLEFFCKNSFIDNDKLIHNIKKSRNRYEEIETEVKDKNGRTFTCRFIPVKLSNNSTGVVCIMTDVTSRKQIDMKIKDNDTKYKKIVDNMPYSVLIANKEDIIYNNNKNEYIDFSKEDIKNIILGQYSSKELYYTYSNGIDTCLNIDKVNYIEGEECRTLFVIRDITSYKNLLKKLECSKKKYESLVNIIPEGIYVLDFDSKMLKYANKAFFNMVGTEELTNIDIDNINKNMIMTSGSINGNVKYKRGVLNDKYGNKVNIECGGMLLDINKKIKMIGIVRDITEQIKAESIEMQIEEKEKLNKSKNEFFINMSHELKTPLNLIHSSNQLIEVVYKNELKENNNIEILNTIDIVKKHVNILMSLIDNMIELAKLQSDFHEFKKDYYNIVDISEEIVDEFSKFIDKEDVDIIFDTDEEEKIVNIDIDDIEKVILILLSVVIKYSMRKSKVVFELGSKKDFITIMIKNSDKYDYDKYTNNSENKIVEMSITLARLIIEFYGGKLNVKVGPSNIEIVIDIKRVYEDKVYKIRTNHKQDGFAYLEYNKMCSF